MPISVTTAKRRCSAMPSESSPNSTRWWLVLGLCVKDLRHDWRVSSALALSIVSVVTPLLLLFGLKTGVVETLREILLKDPRNLEVIIFENTRLPKAWFDKRRSESELVRFVIPRTRTLNTMIDVENQDNYLLKHVELLPTASGDPLLPVGLLPPKYLMDILLTHAAAAQLDVEQGGTVKVWLKRKLDGTDQREALQLHVVGIVPEAAFARPALFVTLDFLEALEDFRDGYAVPSLYFDQGPSSPTVLVLTVDEARLFGMVSRNVTPDSMGGLSCDMMKVEGGLASDQVLFSRMETKQWLWLDSFTTSSQNGFASPFAAPPQNKPKPSVFQGRTRTEPRTSYAGARLYAQNPEDVAQLADSLRASGIEVRTRGEDIARLQAADRLLGRVLGLIALIALLGGYLAFGGAIWISIERKRTALALLRLIGLSGNQIIGFCLQQAVMLGVFAFAVSFLLYWFGQMALNRYGSSLFIKLLQADAQGILLCQLHLREGLIAAAATLLFTIIASLLGVLHAKSFQPAECLREV